MTTKEETLRRIAVMQAWCDGEKIEYSCLGEFNWRDQPDPQWSWLAYDYRIAPKPKRKAVFHAYSDNGALLWVQEGQATKFILTQTVRIPSLDLEAEVDD